MRKTLPLLVAFLLAPVVFAQQYNVVDDFLSEMNQEITGGNVSSGSHISEEVPEELQGIEVLWGYTCKADGSPATYVWVFAKSEDGMISGWTHTTWSDVGVPRRYDVYKHGPGMPQPIYPQHQYYIKGLSWIPMNTEDFPPRNQNPPSPPGWAQGEIRSPTYLSPYWYENTSLHGPDVFFTGNPRMW